MRLRNRFYDGLFLTSASGRLRNGPRLLYLNDVCLARDCLVRVVQMVRVRNHSLDLPDLVIRLVM